MESLFSNFLYKKRLDAREMHLEEARSDGKVHVTGYIVSRSPSEYLENLYGFMMRYIHTYFIDFPLIGF